MVKKYKPASGGMPKMLFILIGATILVSLFFVDVIGKIALTALFLAVAAFFGLLFTRSYYELQEDYLFIRFSFFKLKISYEYIMGIESCTAPISFMTSYSLSRHAVKITVRSERRPDIVYVSPKEREEFVAELAKRCKNLADG